jgi:hypothetical protein
MDSSSDSPVPVVFRGLQFSTDIPAVVQNAISNEK